MKATIPIPAVLAAAFLLTAAPARAQADPVIESVRVSFVIGDDSLRGDSGITFKYWLDDRDGAPVEVPLFGYNPAPFGAPNPIRWSSHSVNSRSFAISPTELSRFRAVGVEHVRDDNQEQWNMDGLVVVGITAAGVEYLVFADLELNFHFRRVNLGPELRVRDWKSPLIRFRNLHALDAEFDAIAVRVETGDDDFRRGSRAFIRIVFRNGSILEVPLVDPAASDEEWSRHTGRNVEVALMNRYRPGDIRQVQVLFEGGSGGGRGVDEWGARAIWVAMFRTTPPLARAEGMQPGPRQLIAVDEIGWPTIRSGNLRSLADHGPLDPFPGPSALNLDITVDTGSDEKRGSSGVYVQAWHPDGTFHELTFLGGLGSGDDFPSHSTHRQTDAVPASWMTETFTRFRVRFRSDWKRYFHYGEQNDEWDFDGLSLILNGPVSGGARVLVDALTDTHKFDESRSHTVEGIGRSSEPLNEAGHITYPDVMWAEIPPIRGIFTLPYYSEAVEPVEITYPEWYDAILSRRNPFDQENKGGSGQDIKNDEFDPFSRYAFALGDGEKPQVYLSALSRDPETGQARMAVTYRRMLGAADVDYRLRYCDDLRKWRDVEPAAGDVHVLPDYINGVEWCEVIVRGGFAKGARGFFSVVAERAE